jgi:hypothetical protein
MTDELEYLKRELQDLKLHMQAFPGDPYAAGKHLTCRARQNDVPDYSFQLDKHAQSELRYFSLLT